MSIHVPRARRTWLLAGGLAALATVSAGAQPGLPPVPVPPQNPITPAKRVLGKILFWDAQLSSDSSTACGSCHVPGSAGVDPRQRVHPGLDESFATADDVIGSPGVIRSDAADDYEPDVLFRLRAQVTRRAASSSIMAAYAPSLFWDGRATTTFEDPQTGGIVIPVGGALESQSVVPILDDAEMAHESRDWAQVAEKLASARPLALVTDLPPDLAAALADDPTYPALFEAAFGGPAITARRIAFAIATYERTLIPDQAPWDLFVQGQPDALTPQERQGLNAFMNPGSRCSVCHEPPFFSDFSFRNIGLRPVAEDRGRMEVTGAPQDRGRFKVPSLRNVGLKSTFMHTGRLATLGQVLDFYLEVNGQQQFPQNQDPLIAGIAIPPPARASIIAFLAGGLTDPRVAAETFPFDRPTLHTELPPNPVVTGSGTPGTGGLVPAIIAQAPPNLGNAGFKIGIDRALGGAEAYLALFRNPPGAGEEPIDVHGPIVLDGEGPGGGYGTWHWPIPDDPALRGDELFVRWRVVDPGAPNGIALTPVARLSFYEADPTSCGCTGDLDCNGFVGFNDLVSVLGAWGGCDLCAADLNDDGIVGMDDLIVVLSAWGACPQ